MCAAILVVCSWVSVQIGVVPVTLQTLGVCLVAGLFGWKRGTLSVLVYILLGALGLPVFSGFKGGAGILLGATGGYIIGFVFIALIVGLVSDKSGAKLLPLIIAMAAGIAVCYAFGTAWFALVYAQKGEPKTLGAILSMCVLPFLLPDIAKLALAALLTPRLKKRINLN